MELADALVSLAASQSHQVNATELMTEILRLAGGPTGLAQYAWAGFQEETNKVQKNSMLKAILALYESVSLQQSKLDPIQSMQTDELAAVLRQFCKDELRAAKSKLCSTCCETLKKLGASEALIAEFQQALTREVLDAAAL